MKHVQRGLGFLLVAMIGVLQGCALFVIGAAAGAGGAGVSYMGNELRVTQEVSVDRAWQAASAAMNDLQFSISADKTTKDATMGTVVAHNARGQDVHVLIVRQSDRLSEIRVRVGVFNTTANRASAQLVYDKMQSRLGR